MTHRASCRHDMKNYLRARAVPRAQRQSTSTKAIGPRRARHTRAGLGWTALAIYSSNIQT
jgi:hypothetical protein